jgi:hypothetical protein
MKTHIVHVMFNTCSSDVSYYKPQSVKKLVVEVYNSKFTIYFIGKMYWREGGNGSLFVKKFHPCC